MSTGKLIVDAFGDAPMKKRTAKMIDFLRSHQLDAKTVRDIILETENAVRTDFCRKNISINTVYDPLPFYCEMYRLMRDEEIYVESCMGNIIKDDLDKALSVMAERVQEVCANGGKNASGADILAVAVWMHAKASKNHHGQMNTLLQICGQVLDTAELRKFRQLGQTSELAGLIGLEKLREAQDHVDIGWAERIGIREVMDNHLAATGADTKFADGTPGVDRSDCAIEVVRQKIRDLYRLSDVAPVQGEFKAWVAQLVHCYGGNVALAEKWMEEECPGLVVPA